MKVLQVMASGARGGGAEHLLGLMPALETLGVESIAAVGRDGPLVERLTAAGLCAEGIDLLGRRASPVAGLRSRRLIARIRPDLVHFHGTRAAFWGGWTRPRPLPAVYTAHGLAFRQVEAGARRWAMDLAERVACAGCSRVICVARADLEVLDQRRMLRPGQGVHIGNAVAAARIGRADRQAVRRHLGLKPEDLVIGTVSRLVPQKAVGTFIDLLAHLTGARGMVVGDGPERAGLEARAAACQGRVIFLGSRDDVPDLLGAMDLFVLTSRWEGEPVALLEAMASGLACVATATSGAAELIEDGVNGLLVPVGSPAPLFEAVQRLSNDSERRAALGAAARASVAGRSFACVAEQVHRVYLDALSLQRPGPMG